jgi:hypothetical protein
MCFSPIHACHAEINIVDHNTIQIVVYVSSNIQLADCTHKKIRSLARRSCDVRWAAQNVQKLSLAGLLNVNFSLDLHTALADMYQGTIAISGLILDMS